MNVVAITRRVRPGHEQAFEESIREFFRSALDQPGSMGASLIRPLEGSGSNEYGILRVFADAAARDRFYASDAYGAWSERVAPLVEGGPEKRPVHGLEAFFRGSGAPPPAWKMAIVTWLGVNPAVYVSSQLAHLVAPGLRGVADLLVVNTLVVAILTWIVMPLLTRLFRRWLVAPSSPQP